ncbi:MAG: chromate resistance protein [Deltaproteobacteria bacterium]|nr:chromate resistance protein [Deltaproteobacteria bacterium]
MKNYIAHNIIYKEKLFSFSNLSLTLRIGWPKIHYYLPSRTETEGLNKIIIGLSLKLRNDKKLLDKGMEIFDSLYQYFSLKRTKWGKP